MGTLGVKHKLDIDPALGTITPQVVEELKEEITFTLEDELCEHIERFGLIKWHIDAERREISGELILKVQDD